MTLATRVAEVVDVGLWTLGIVLSGAIVLWKYDTSGVEAAATAFLILVAVTLILGVTGSRATASVAAVVEDREGET